MQEGHLLENFKANMKANQNWANVRYWSNSGQRSVLACDGLAANDPKATLAPFAVGAAPLFDNVLFCQNSYTTGLAEHPRLGGSLC